MPSIIRTTVISERAIGLDDVKKKLTALGPRIATNVLRRGLVAAAGLIRDEARIRVPVRTKRLKKAIAAESRGVFKDGSGKPVGHRAVTFIRKPKEGKRSARKYAHLAEFGTLPHHIGKGSITHIYKGSKEKPVKRGGLHPGARPKPFLRPAFDAKKDEALVVAERKIREELVKELAKLSRTKLA